MVFVLARGGLFVFPGATPMDSLQTFNLYKVQVLVASPGGLSGILKFYEESKAFRSGFRVICTTGSALHKSLSDRVRARLCPELIFHYGSGETSTVAAAPGHMVADIPGAVGYPAPGVTVQIVDAQDRLLPPGEEGSIRIASPLTIQDYFGDPAQTARSFRNGYFHPGDRGLVTSGGMLLLSGRDTDVLNLGGDKIQPNASEAVLSACPAIAEVAVFGGANALGAEEVWAAIV